MAYLFGLPELPASPLLRFGAIIFLKTYFSGRQSYREVETKGVSKLTSFHLLSHPKMATTARASPG